MKKLLSLCRSLKNERCKDVVLETTEKEIFSVRTQFKEVFADYLSTTLKLAPKKESTVGWSITFLKRTERQDTPPLHSNCDQFISF